MLIPCIFSRFWVSFPYDIFHFRSASGTQKHHLILQEAFCRYRRNGQHSLIANWNNRETETDDIYILGNLFYRTATPTRRDSQASQRKKTSDYRESDHSWMPKVNFAKYFEEVKDLIVLKEHGSVMTLCHYPMLSWPHSFHGVT